jgi:EAL domain-containing protein (putative c-di-GMP-specific phosphodiesterase class I)
VIVVTLVPGPWSAAAASPEDAVARVLADPGGVRGVHRPVVDLLERTCCGYLAGVRLAGVVGQDAEPWFRAAARTGHGDRLAEVALTACLRGRATLPGDRFLVVPLDVRRLGAGHVLDLLDAEDDVGDLVLRLDRHDDGPRSSRELPGRAADRLAALRARGLRLAVGAGQAGADDLAAMRAWHPDVFWLPEAVVRDVHTDPVRRRLVRVVVELADEDPADGTGPRLVAADAVESPAEVAALHDLGVDWALGWLFGRARSGFPPPAVDLDALLPRPAEVDLTDGTRHGLL